MNAEAPTFTSGELENHSLWYRYKTQVWPEKSPEAVTAHNIMRVIRGIHFPSEVAYMSVPITTGRKYYEAVAAAPFAPLDSIVGDVIQENYITGSNFQSELKKRLNCPIISPADFGPIDQRWGQPHFQALWLEIIAEKATQLHMAEGWEFSSGGVEEFIHAMQLKLGLPKHQMLAFFNTKEHEADERQRMRNIAIFDHNGNSLSIDDGIRLLDKSEEWLSKQIPNENPLREVFSHAAGKMANNLELLRWTKEQLDRDFYQ